MLITENLVPSWPVEWWLSCKLVSEGLKSTGESNEEELFFQVLKFDKNKTVYVCDELHGVAEIWTAVCWKTKRNFFQQELKEASDFYILHSHLNSLTHSYYLHDQQDTLFLPQAIIVSIYEFSFLFLSLTWFNEDKNASHGMQKIMHFFFSQRWLFLSSPRAKYSVQSLFLDRWNTKLLL